MFLILSFDFSRRKRRTPARAPKMTPKWTNTAAVTAVVRSMMDGPNRRPRKAVETETAVAAAQSIGTRSDRDHAPDPRSPNAVDHGPGIVNDVAVAVIARDRVPGHGPGRDERGPDLGADQATPTTGARTVRVDVGADQELHRRSAPSHRRSRPKNGISVPSSACNCRLVSGLEISTSSSQPLARCVTCG